VPTALQTIVLSLAISPGYAADRRLCAGTYDGVSCSTDGGATWSAPAAVSPSASHALAFIPQGQAPPTLFALTNGLGVFRSNDLGQSWQAANTGLADLHTRALAFLPASGAVLLSAADGLYESTDEGATWQRIDAGASLHALSPAHDGSIFAGSEQGVVRSIDGGVSWQPASLGLSSLKLQAIALSPDFDHDHTIFVGAAGGAIYRSTDRGATWQLPGPPLKGWEVTSLVVSRQYANDQTLFAATSTSVYRSADRGASWELVFSGFGGLQLYTRALILSPDFATDGTVFAVTIGDGVYRSTDRGVTWQAINEGFEEGATHIRALALSPDYASDHILIAATEWGVIYQSIDGGDQWLQFSADLEFLRISELESLAIGPLREGQHVVVAGTSDGGFYASTDDGESWSAVSIPLGRLDLTALYVGRRDDTRDMLFVGTPAGLWGANVKRTPNASP